MFRAALLGLVIVTAACGSSSTTAPKVEPPSTTEVWTGSLTLGASRFYSFNVPLTGTVSVQLTSLTQNGAASTEELTIGLGGPRATECVVSGSVVAKASDTLILTGEQTPGTYCVKVWDNAQLSTTAAFSININHPKQ
jgi:hypothetical protein